MKSKKTLMIVLCAVVLVVATVAGTLAYLTDRETVTNTFTVGDVQITLDEAKVNPDGTKVIPEQRVKSNSYHLIPGKTYVKDPTMTVEATSEESYVRMRVSVNKLSQLDAIFAPNGADLKSIFVGYDETVWEYVGETEENNTITYEFRYFETVKKADADQILPALFTDINLPGFVTGDQLATLYVSETDKLTITVVGDAIQAETFANANEAWAAFEAQTDKVNN
jgi:predicted ribosomally synthesized peptide with SipW-like signal peptide